MNVSLSMSSESNHLAIERAACELATLKFDLDTKARINPSHVPGDLHGPCSGGEYGPHFGRDFISSILPFVPKRYSSKTPIVMNVPTHQVLGCSWRIWPDPNISRNEREEVITYIQSKSGIVDTLYTYIPQLSIFMAEEGKNRVNFCRYHKVPFIPARVMKMDYPDASRIKVYSLALGGGHEVWAVLDNRYLQKVTHYAYALPMLRAYGVEVSDDWPEDILSPREIIKNTSEQYSYRNDSELVDIHSVKKRIEEIERLENEEAYFGVWQLKVSIKRALKIGMTIMIMGLAGLWLTQWNGEAFRWLPVAAIAFSSGVLFATLYPVIQTKQKHVKESMRKHLIRNS